MSSISSDWVEGTASGYEPQAGSSSFQHKQIPNVPWTNDGGDITRVILGNGGTVWGMAGARRPTRPVGRPWRSTRRWSRRAVAGLSHGFVVFDETGTEWTRDGEKFTRHSFPNRFFDSRESGCERGRIFTVELGPRSSSTAEERRDIPQSDAADIARGRSFGRVGRVQRQRRRPASRDTKSKSMVAPFPDILFLPPEKRVRAR